MLRRAQPVRRSLELLGGDSRVRFEHAAEERPHVRVVAGVVLGHRLSQPAVVALVRRLPRLRSRGAPDRPRPLAQPAQDEDRLEAVGFSHHSVPSLSKTATRSGGGTTSGVSRARRSRGSPPRGPVVPGGERLAMLIARTSSDASSFSTTWSIVKLAASWRGGNSSNVCRNCVDDGRRRQDDVGVVEQPVVVGVRRDVGALERVRAQVEELRHAQRHERLGPDLQRALRPAAP